MNNVADRLAAVRDRMARACQKVRRPEGDVRLVAVSKKVAAETIRAAALAGVNDFGENYVQEAREKMALLPDTLSWHMIGHVQTNKARHAAALFRYVHSVDRQEILDALEKSGKPLDVLFELNLSGEPQKHGTTKDGLKRMLERVHTLKALRPVGLMTMAPYVDDPEEVRYLFAALCNLLAEVNREFSLDMKELSMGMSSDFECAIEEGATMVRIGTAIFGERS